MIHIRKEDGIYTIRNLDAAEIEQVAGGAAISLADDFCGTVRPRFPFPFPTPFPGPCFPRPPRGPIVLF